MSNVYSFSGFARVLIKHGVKFSIRDFLSDDKVDDLIAILIKKICDDDNYINAGIARSCFIDYEGDCAIKVDKRFYTSYYDDDARSLYEDDIWYSDEDFVEGAWAINRLNQAVGYTGCPIDQNEYEISAYNRFLTYEKELLDYVPKLYATSNNLCVEIFERCSECPTRPRRIDYERYMNISESFHDTHEGNFGINRLGKLVLLDFGFES